MKPPKCKGCGKEEWRHVCGPVDRIGIVKAIGCSFPNGALVVEPGGSFQTGSIPKSSRKEYLKLKARERRARQKAAKSGKDAH